MFEKCGLLRLDISAFVHHDAGAKWISEIYDRGLITFEEALKLLSERYHEVMLEEAEKEYSTI